MRTSAAPNMANIHLHVYEHEYFPYLYENNFNNKLANKTLEYFYTSIQNIQVDLCKR